MFIRQNNTIINTQITPVIKLQGTDIRFQTETDIHAPYTKLSFETNTFADKVFNLISDAMVKRLPFLDI